MSQRTIVTGTLILTAANLITKCMGFFNRIFLSDTIGTEGIGLYQLILPIYSLAWSITSAGLATTISSLTAQEHIRGQNGNIGLIVKLSVCLSLCISLLFSILLFLHAEAAARYILHDSRAILPLQLLSFVIPFMSAGSCFRGFFLGMQETVIPAISQILEQSVRIAVIYFLADIFVPLGLSYACAAAIAGIFFGELLSCCFTAWNYMHYKRKRKFTRRPALSSTAALSAIMTMAVPLSASRISSSLLSSVEHLLIPQQLQQYGQNPSQALTTYGELTGMAMPLILLPSACLMAASVSLVPEISEASAVKEDYRITKTVSATFLFTFIIGFGAAALFAVFPKEICFIVYNRISLGDILFPLAFLCPLLYAQMILHGLLNGLGEQFFLFRNNVLSALISIAMIWFAMPVYGITAFLFGWLLSLLFSVITALHTLWKRTGALPSFFNCFLKPLLAGTAAALLVKYCIRICEPSKILFISSLTGMGLLYLLFLFLLGCLSKNELSFLAKNKKSRS